MPSCRFDVLGLGNAIVDLISTADDDFLLAQGLRTGTKWEATRLLLVPEEQGFYLAQRRQTKPWHYYPPE